MLPLAVSDYPGESTLFVAGSNAGNSVVGAPIKDHAKQNMTTTYPILVRRVDDLVADMSGFVIRSLKLDVQGYECKALLGMRRLLTAGVVRAATLEMADTWLKPNGCSSDLLLGLLSSFGFLVDVRDTPRCIYGRYGCDMTFRWRGVDRCRWEHPHDPGKSWVCVPVV